MKILSEEEYRIYRFKNLPPVQIGYKEINFAKDYIYQLEQENQKLKLIVETLTKAPYEYSVRGN